MRSMFDVPVEERSEFSAKLLSSPRHDRRPTEEIGLEREDESLDDCNAAVLTDNAVAKSERGPGCGRSNRSETGRP
jgi:hypothetical protein